MSNYIKFPKNLLSCYLTHATLLSKMQGNSLILTLVLLFSAFPLNSNAAENSNQMIITGWLETVILAPWQIKLRAKLDTGAKTSSIHAENIERFQRDDKPWIRFQLPQGRHKKNKPIIMEAKMIREVMIKRHKLPAVSRAVVELNFCMNEHYYTSEFSLADRGNFNYPVLLGRRFLRNKILVDASKTFTHPGKENSKCEVVQGIQSATQTQQIPSAADTGQQSKGE